MTELVIRRAEVPAEDPCAAETLARALGAGPFALVVVFVSPQVNRPGALMAQLDTMLSPAALVGCTTAGEIGASGYVEGVVVAMAFPASLFIAQTLLIEDLGAIDPAGVTGDLIRQRSLMAAERPAWTHDFAFLLVDGLSGKEDELAAALAPGLGATPLFGGSAADGTRFLETFVFHRDRVLRNAAVLVQLRTACPVRVFKFDHFRPTETRMVVTGADPSRRIVHEINAEPAALEYARLLGKDPAQLTPFTFAAHPVVVRIGGQHHVRSIRQVDENGDLIFYSAIDEGLVLTLAEADDMVEHLKGSLAGLSSESPPDAILACDCMLRRMEAQEKQLTTRVSALLRDHGVTGFSTYGEQLNAMHVNQTLTGVAIYAPDPAR